MSFLDALPSRLQKLETDILPGLTMMVQNYARENGWPREAWTALQVDYRDDVDFKGYRITYWKSPDDVDHVRNAEYGFGDSDGVPAGRKMANRLNTMATYLIAKRLGGGM